MKTQDAQNYCKIGSLLLIQDAACLKCGRDWSVHIFKGKAFHSLIVDGIKEFWNRLVWAKSWDSVEMMDCLFIDKPFKDSWSGIYSI